MQRLLQSRAASIRVTVTDQDGTPVNADANPTVTVRDGAGATIVSGNATAPGGAGIYAFALTPGQVAILDTYTATWAVVRGGQAETLVTHFEVVGGFLFTVAEARAFDNNAMADTTTYPTATLIAAREQVEEDLELMCNVAFVARGRRITEDGTGSETLQSGVRRVRSILSGSIDGTALTVAQLALLDPYPDGRIVYNDGSWTEETRNVVLHVTHGYDQVPPKITRAALLLLRDALVASNIDDRALSHTDELGTRQLAVPGGRIAPRTGLPEVDAIIERYAEGSIVVG